MGLSGNVYRYTYILTLAFIVVLSLFSGTITGSAQETGGPEIIRLPYVFSSAILLKDGTVAGVMDGRLVFLNGIDVVKSIPLIGGSGVVSGFPRDGPLDVVAYTSGGDVVLANSGGEVLYRSIVGFGTLRKAFYSSGIVYMMVDTPRGREMYAYDVDARIWGYVSLATQNISNAFKLLEGSVIDMVDCSNGVSLLYDPILPPGVSNYTTIPILVVNATGVPVMGANVVLYYRDYDFSLETKIDGSGLIKIPLPLSELDVFVEYNGTWYFYTFHQGDFTLSGITVTVPGDKAVPPPTHLARHYAVVLDGFRVKYVQPVGTAASIIACSGSRIALYDSTKSMLYFVDMDTGDKTGFGLDSAPVSSAIRRDVLAIATSAGTLYVFSMSSKTLYATYSFPGLEKVALSNDYVFAYTGSALHAVSLRSFKDVFIYESAGLPLTTPYLYVTPENVIMFSTTDSTLIVHGLNSTEPFSFKSYIPYKIQLNILDPWGNRVPEAKVYVDNIYVGETNDNGSIKFSLNSGEHSVIIFPPAWYTNLTETSTTIMVEKDSVFSIVMNRTIYLLSLTLKDPETGGLKEPVNLTVSDNSGRTLLTKRMYRENNVKLWVPKGKYIAIISPLEELSVYKKTREIINVGGDTDKTITLNYAFYPVVFKVVDSDTGEQLNATICAWGMCTSNNTLKLPKGEHSVTVRPLLYYGKTPLYNPATITIKVPTESPVIVKVVRAYHLVNLSFLDNVDKKLVRKPLNVMIGGIKYKEVRSLKLLLPRGRTLVTVEENDLYVPMSTALDVNKDGNYSIIVHRKEKTVVIRVSSVVGRVSGGFLVVKSPSGYSKVMPLTDNAEVTLSLPIDWYTVTYENPLYQSTSLAFDLNYENSVDLLVRPTLKGLFILYSNIILAVSGVVVATGILYWISRRTIARVRSIREISELLGEEAEEAEEDEGEAASEEEG